MCILRQPSWGLTLIAAKNYIRTYRPYIHEVMQVVYIYTGRLVLCANLTLYITCCFQDVQVAHLHG